MIDVKGLFKRFEECVVEDIENNGYPAFMYNFAHSQKVINTIDRYEDWLSELKTFQRMGYSERIHGMTIKIGGIDRPIRIHTLQPLKRGKVDARKFKRSSIFLNDPLAMAVGYMITGFCYIEFVNNTENMDGSLDTTLKAFKAGDLTLRNEDIDIKSLTENFRQCMQKKAT